jgi:hypothetical protein
MLLGGDFWGRKLKYQSLSFYLATVVRHSLMVVDIHCQLVHESIELEHAVQLVCETKHTPTYLELYF